MAACGEKMWQQWRNNPLLKVVVTDCLFFLLLTPFQIAANVNPFNCFFPRHAALGSQSHFSIDLLCYGTNFLSRIQEISSSTKFRKAIEDHWTRYKYITDTNIPIPLSSDL